MPLGQLTTKPHYLILDGLRGVAAILVVIFHLFEGVYPDPANNPVHHGYLAVDFFFLLSGFVVGYAYDDRWGRMSIKDFFKIRLVRLHPLVILGVLIGLVCFLFDPYTPSAGFLKITAATLLGFLLLPAPDIRGWGETHPLDGPCWSLLQEYIANLLYALFGRKMSKTALWIFVVIAAGLLTYVAVWRGNVGTGWSYSTFWIASVRMLFPFFAGLLLFRSAKLIKLPFTFPLCSLLLALLFIMPTFKFNGVYEAACIIIAFPFIVAAGTGGQVSGKLAKLCKFSADISYPIYITHYPFIYIYTSWIYIKKPPSSQILPVAIGLFAFFILLAYAALKLFDEPVRKWLKKKVLIRK
jgi:peptidoglycan/LPS O-acetylase OafA/YrhL